jgi:hypothetical protein
VEAWPSRRFRYAANVDQRLHKGLEIFQCEFAFAGIRRAIASETCGPIIFLVTSMRATLYRASQFDYQNSAASDDRIIKPATAFNIAAMRTVTIAQRSSALNCAIEPRRDPALGDFLRGNSSRYRN